MKRARHLILFITLIAGSNVQAQLWKQYIDSARSFQQQGRMDKMEENYIKANELLRRDSFWTETHGRIVNSLAGIYWRKGDYKNAAVYGEEALQVAKHILTPMHPFYATSCHNLGMVFSALGEYEKSEKYYLEARHLREKLFGKKNRDYAATCNTLGLLYVDMGQYSLAKQYYQEAKSTFAETIGMKSEEYAICCSNLANLYKRAGIYESAEPLYLEAMNIWGQMDKNNSTDYAGCCTNLAGLYMLVAKTEKAEKLLLEARDVLARTVGKDHPDYAVCCYSLAGLYAEKGQFREAETSYLEAGSVFEKTNGKDHPDYAKNLNAIGYLYANEKRFDEAEKCFKDAKNIIEKVVGKEHPDNAIISHDLASLYLRLGRNDQALPLFMEAKQVFQSTYGIYHPDYIAACENIAAIYMKMNNSSAALEQFKIAFDAQEGLMRKVFMVTTENEKLSYVRRVRRLNEEIFSLNTSGGNKIDKAFLYDLVLSSRNTLLTYNTQLRQAINSFGDTALIKKYNDWINLREKISFAFSQSISKRPANFSALEEKANEYEKELIRAFMGVSANESWERVTSADLRSALLTDEAAVEFITYQYFNGDLWTDSIYYSALVLRKNQQQPELIHLFEEKELTGLLKLYKGTGAGQVQINQLYGPTAVQAGKSSPSLYDLIWKPLEDKLAGVKRIYLSSAGSLFKISFATIPMDNGRLLSDKYQLVQLNTTASLTGKKIEKLAEADQLVLYGGVYYDVDSTGMRMAAMGMSNNEIASRSLPDDLSRDAIPGFRYLAGTEKEVTDVKRLANQSNFPVNINEGRNATEESFKQLTGNKSPAIIHIATHGFFFPDPGVERRNSKRGGRDAFRQSEDPLLRSGLALSGANNAWKDKAVLGVQDGILTAYEVSNMYLPNTKLSVLSACETGLGDIQGSEGVYGLQRAFKMAGVEYLVMSLWKVPDTETAEFMQQFYKNLFAKQSIQDAFFNAQNIMKNKYRSDPYKWAAWVLIR